VERFLKCLRDHRDTIPAESERPLEELYEDPARFRPFIENHMVKMLSLRADEMTDGMMIVVDLDRGRLRAAKRALRRIDEFGLQHDPRGSRSGSCAASGGTWGLRSGENDEADRCPLIPSERAHR
jgi:hypothetical protein